MIHYATYFDRHYLTRGLALYRSLVRHSPPFVLWALCLDEETYRTLARMRLGSLALIPLAELERNDGELLAVKASRRPDEYYLTCTAPLLLYVMEQHPHVDSITYLDADLYFFADPAPIYCELGDRPILIVEHRFPLHTDGEFRRTWHRRLERFGRYNVGLLVFRRSPEGIACLRWWRERCLEWCYLRLGEGGWGDQKYLEDWPGRFEGVVVLRHKGAGLGPWNLANYRFRVEAGELFADEDPLVLYHFSKLRVITRWLYEPDLKRGGYQMPALVKRHVYIPYVRELRAAGELMRAAGGDVDPVDSVRFGRDRWRTLRRMLRHRSFLVVTDRLAF